jgi:hypothetical protein
MNAPTATERPKTAPTDTKSTDQPEQHPYRTLADLMRESPPKDGEYVYRLANAVPREGGAFVKAKTPNGARATVVDVERVSEKEMRVAAVDALRANGEK